VLAVAGLRPSITRRAARASVTKSFCGDTRATMPITGASAGMPYSCRTAPASPGRTSGTSMPSYSTIPSRGPTL
jgi:hypothetical protein